MKNEYALNLALYSNFKKLYTKGIITSQQLDLLVKELNECVNEKEWTFNNLNISYIDEREISKTISTKYEKITGKRIDDYTKGIITGIFDIYFKKL